MIHVIDIHGDLKGQRVHMMEHALTCAMASKLKALSSCSSHHMQGLGHIVATLQLGFRCKRTKCRTTGFKLIGFLQEA